MKNRHLVRLIPLGRFFFGSENTFSASDAVDKTVITNYLVKSRKYPQQTTLLGMLRFQLLMKEKKLQDDWDEKRKLIGGVSFDGGQTTKWGVIDSISPLFLMKGADKYIIAGRHQQFYKNDNKEELVSLTPKALYNAKSDYQNELQIFTDYNPKEHESELWASTNNENDFLKPIDIFEEQFQVGITKNRQGKVDDDAYYKQYSYKFITDDLAFGFYVDFDESSLFSNDPMMVSMGGDQSLFQMTITKDKDADIFERADSRGTNALILLSDAYCESSEILKLCNAAMTRSVDFRYLKTSTETISFYSRSDKKSDMQRSVKLNLLERGSVLFSDNVDELAKILDRYTAYKNAGFNYYKTELIN